MNNNDIGDINNINLSLTSYDQFCSEHDKNNDNDMGLTNPTDKEHIRQLIKEIEHQLILLSDIHDDLDELCESNMLCENKRQRNDVIALNNHLASLKELLDEEYVVEKLEFFDEINQNTPLLENQDLDTPDNILSDDILDENNNILNKDNDNPEIPQTTNVPNSKFPINTVAITGALVGAALCGGVGALFGIIPGVIAGGVGSGVGGVVGGIGGMILKKYKEYKENNQNYESIE